MKFHFGCISKRPNILMSMCRHFISGSVYMIFYHPKKNFISVKMTDMKSTPAMSFKRTYALSTISIESVLIHFTSAKFCSHENLMPVWNFIDRYEIHTVLSFILPLFMWTQVKSWQNTEVEDGNEGNHGENLRIGIEYMIRTVELDKNKRKCAHLYKYSFDTLVWETIKETNLNTDFCFYKY